jgi:hypothetical protein
MASTISAGTTAGTAIAIAGDTTGNLAFQTNGTTTAMTIDTSQNVGIGTTGPSAKLMAVQSNPTRGIIARFNNSGSSSQTGAQIQLSQAGIQDWAFGQPAGVDAFAFWSGRDISSADGTERMRIDSAGKVTIATSGTNLYLSTVFGSESFSIDAGATRLTLANGASADVSASGSFSGYLMMNECTVTGQMAMYVAGSGTVNIFGQVGGAFTNSSGSGSYRFYHAGGGVFRLSNQSGSTGTFGIITFRTRNSG